MTLSTDRKISSNILISSTFGFHVEAASPPGCKPYGLEAVAINVLLMVLYRGKMPLLHLFFRVISFESRKLNYKSMLNQALRDNAVFGR